MFDVLKIYVDRLMNGQTELVQGRVKPGFLHIEDDAISFENDVSLNGRAYVAENHVILQLDIETNYETHCKICNEKLTMPVALKGIYITEDLNNIKGKIFDYSEVLRETIILEIPFYSECKGNCPSREELKKYLKNES